MLLPFALAQAGDDVNGISWFHPGLQPIKEFAFLEVRDRSRYFNESNLGKALGLDVKNRPCGQDASTDSNR
jgi:hypothetical protein